MAATPAVVKKLLDQLIESATQSQITEEEDPENFELCRDYALKSVKNHKFGGTNHFEVAAKLQGLQEKFRIYDKDDIADALRLRLDELHAVNFKWSAEALSVILNLSENPIKFSNIHDLDALIPDEPDRPLTWADIIAEEPLEGDIWVEPDYEEDSDLSSIEDEIETEVDEPGSYAGEKAGKEGADEEKITPVECFVTTADWNHLNKIKAAQYWHVPERADEVDTSLSHMSKVDQLWMVSELQAVREILFMLLGCPCSIFEVGRRTLATGKDPVVVWVDASKLKKQRFALRHSSFEAFVSILTWFAERGTAVNRIREFIKRKELLPARQSFLAALAGSLSRLNKTLAEQQSWLVETGETRVVSILKLQRDLEAELRPFLFLASIVTSLVKPSNDSKYSSQHLNLLFESTCSLQSIGDLRSFEFMAIIFFQCLQTYLRPIREWMESGELRPNDTNFFVIKARSDDEVNLGSLWHDQYAILEDDDGNLKAPNFVLSVAKKIFTTGKTVVFLKRLIDYDTPPIPSIMQDDDLNFRTIYPQDRISNDDELAPFDELFTIAFEAWIHAKHHSVSNILRDVLYRDCGLWKHLSAIDHIYLCRDGHQLSALATVVFDKIDKGRMNMWDDRFLLTELVQSVYGGRDFIEVKRLGVRRVTSGIGYRGLLGGDPRSVKLLGGIAIEYNVPWPMLNILQETSFQTYKRIFTFLLQLRRAKMVLEKLRVFSSREDLRNLVPYEEAAMYYHLKHRLLWFVNVINTYITDLAISPLTRKMREDMSKAVDVDGMIAVHGRYVRELMNRCLLGKPLQALHSAILSLLDLSVIFSDEHTKYALEISQELGLGRDRSSNSPFPFSGSGSGPGVAPLLADSVMSPTNPRTLPPSSYKRTAADSPPHHRRHRRRRRQNQQNYHAAESSETSEGSPDDYYYEYDEGPDNEDSNPASPSHSPNRDPFSPNIPSPTPPLGDTSFILNPNLNPNPNSNSNSDNEDSSSERGFSPGYARKLHRMGKRFMELLEFVKNGLRGVSRAGVLPHLDMLAEQLEAGRFEGGGRGGF